MTLEEQMIKEAEAALDQIVADGFWECERIISGYGLEDEEIAKLLMAYVEQTEEFKRRGLAHFRAEIEQWQSAQLSCDAQVLLPFPAVALRWRPGRLIVLAACSVAIFTRSALHS
jgi:hypothetical protein